MNRDDFSKVVIEALAKRVGQRCSYCGKPTSGPHTTHSKAVIVGVAAHISAASPGGPRYDASLSSEDRKNASNGIWLCESCGKLIDSDVARYSVEVLRERKRLAEERALADLEERPHPPVSSSHSFQFAVDNWQLSRERGNLPGDPFVVIGIWGRGDLQYACNVRLRNNSDQEEQLYNVRIQIRAAERLIHEDYYAYQNEIILPPKKWVTVPINYGLSRKEEHFFAAADAFWFAAEIVGGSDIVAWKIAEIDHTTEIPIPS